MMWRTAAAMLAAFAALPAQAADKYPSRPITLVNPYVVGGPTDIHLRVLAPLAEKVFGVPVIIDNKPGAGGTLGPATVAATAKPDGYTIAQVGVGIFTVPHMQKVSFDPAKDFTYIIHLAEYRFQVIARPDAPWKTWKELVADAKANPGKINYASAGAGAGLHIGMEQISLAVGMKLTHVPMRGASEQVTALLGNHVQMIPTGGLAIPLLESGQAIGLLTWTKERRAKLPDLPTLTEEGITLDVDPTSPYGLAGPKGMDPALVKVIHDGFKKAADMQEHKDVLDRLEMDYSYKNPADYAVYVQQQIKGYAALMDKLGLKKN